jgi:dihydroflavonol-4-reductase
MKCGDGWPARNGVDPGDALSFVAAELTDASCWDAAMESVATVLHVASPIPATVPKDPETLIRPAREGTLNVMHAAARSSVRRVVQTLSAAAVMYGCDNPNARLFTEDDWTDPAHRDNSPYTRSKTLAERAGWSGGAAAAEAGSGMGCNPARPCTGTRARPGCQRDGGGRGASAER